MSLPRSIHVHSLTSRDGYTAYTTSWTRALPDVNLDGVEYKCLPSGLHGVKEDVIYFVHGPYAGVSAFVQEEADAQHRNAQFVAVGALVPLSYGRLGKSWLHVAELRRLARDAIEDNDDRRPLEVFWESHGEDQAAGVDAPTPSVIRRMSLPPGLERKRKRSHSSSSPSLPFEQSATHDHPALAMPDLLDTFGPLIFPLYRAALLRKRILLLGSPPVQQTCNYIYDLSILSSIPPSLTDVVQPDSDNLLRIQTLFNVGVHDIPFLTEQKRRARWLACTTDDILGEKQQLYDLLVSLPPISSSSTSKQWPKMRTAAGQQIKATQRDLRRYHLLRSQLNPALSSSQRYKDDASDDEDDEQITPLMRASTTALLDEVKQTPEAGESEILEPVSWTAMAYNGFMWWASAGEMQAWENEEARSDRELLDELPDSDDLLRHIGGDSDTDEADLAIRQASAAATVMTAYFHRLTAQILQPLADVVDDADDEAEEGLAESELVVSADDLRAMGLEGWSQGDREFVKEATGVYFGREARVEEGGTRICGVKIC